MAKLFIFGIGGTGSRVIKALTMLMACGVKLEKTDVVIPIIIDPDTSNGDLTKTHEILSLYKDIFKIGHSENENSTFFDTEIKSLDELGEGGFASTNFRAEIDGVKNSLFKDFIGYNSLDDNNKAFLSLLFSKENLDSNMDVGFKGNPNIGSVVLNKFKDTRFFKKFAQSFGQNDRIFIISSIFGGTGAAGFPLILKNIRGADKGLSNFAWLQNSKIGAITVLPYFSVDNIDNKTTIESDTFVSKTKAALNYYERNITDNSSINALYYIGDDPTNNKVQGSDGTALQQNKAHFIELAAALAIVDFMKIPDTAMDIINGKVQVPRYCEYGLKDSTNTITFNSIGKTTKEDLVIPLTQYYLFQLFYRDYFDNEHKMAFARIGKIKLQKSKLDSVFREDLTKFNSYFEQWLIELAGSKIEFLPFNFNPNKASLLDIVVGTSPDNNRIHGEEFLIKTLNKIAIKNRIFDALPDINKKLLATFSTATKEVIKERIFKQ